MLLVVGQRRISSIAWYPLPDIRPLYTGQKGAAIIKPLFNIAWQSNNGHSGSNKETT